VRVPFLRGEGGSAVNYNFPDGGDGASEGVGEDDGCDDGTTIVLMSLTCLSKEHDTPPTNRDVAMTMMRTMVVPMMMMVMVDAMTVL
jgi:hypothetical protein